MDEDDEPEFIDLAELGSKATKGTTDEMSASSSDLSNDSASVNEDDFGMEDGEEVWICRFCDRAFDTELDLTSHEKQHK